MNFSVRAVNLEGKVEKLQYRNKDDDIVIKNDHFFWTFIGQCCLDYKKKVFMCVTTFYKGVNMVWCGAKRAWNLIYARRKMIPTAIAYRRGKIQHYCSRENVRKGR